MRHFERSVAHREDDGRKDAYLERQRIESHCGVLWYEACCEEGGQTRCRVAIKVGVRLSQCDCGGLLMHCDIALTTVPKQ